MHLAPKEVLARGRTDHKTVRIERVADRHTPFRVVVTWHGRTLPPIYCTTREAANRHFTNHMRPIT